ncbi:Pancreatic trypsin inhibitor [Tupaia chinensis]|uniref:Pancreatic trypsin inhibitor n=1 Tax=Tupaia chinensis TaxID=246437 RepID=L9KFJ2_TUPCH|nr:Pancreatic trypsin inhibitor [Tupaia chinensis]
MNRLGLSMALLVLLAILGVSALGFNTIENGTTAPSKASRPDFCLQPAYTGPCKARFTRYYFNSTAGSCQTFVYGGCRGNKNNFRKMDDCIKTCSAK